MSHEQLKTSEERMSDERSEERTKERMLSWFVYDHLKGELQGVASQFRDMAETIASTIERGPERTVALRKLLEAKDAAIRAVVKPGG